MGSPVLRPRVLRSSSDSTSSDPHSSSESSPTLSLSSSTTSLSSIDQGQSVDKNGKLVDTYGNPFEIPDFTIKQIRDAIPAHCFERSALRGLAYVARDLAYLTVVFYAFQFQVIPALADFHPFVRGTAWAIYTFMQGCIATGLWVLAHECGHQAFSTSKLLNDIVGWVLHSALFVPYFSWKISHGKHHKATGHLERDMVFVPKSRSEYSRRYAGGIGHDISQLTEETPIATLIHLVQQQLFGWPMYITSNVTGHNYHSRQIEGRGKGKQNGPGGGVNHFDPRSPLYEAKDAKWIVLSDIGIALAAYCFYLACQKWGLWNVAIWYGVPYFWVNHWLVAITFLQHTDPSLPHYHPESWSYTRGAAATIDREFGFIGRHLMHGIVETHVAHHFVSAIPFYHGDEATEAIKKVMGKHYRSDTEDGAFGFIKALWKCARWCQWVEECEGADGEGKGVVFFRNRNGFGMKPKAKSDLILRPNEEKNNILLGFQ